MDCEDSGVGEEDLADLPLDEVFRRMKEDGKFQAGQSAVGVSPLLRPEKPGRWIGARCQDLRRKTTVANQLARKKIKLATTFDLRTKLIQMRTAGMDLRYKIIAHMINKLKQREVANARRGAPNTVHHHGVRMRPAPVYYCGGSQLTGLGDFQPRVTHNTISRIQRLVGNLPSWMTNGYSRAATPSHDSGNSTNLSRCSSAMSVGPDYSLLCSTQPNYANILAAKPKHIPITIDDDDGGGGSGGPPPLVYAPPLARDLPPPLDRATPLTAAGECAPPQSDALGVLAAPRPPRITIIDIIRARNKMVTPIQPELENIEIRIENPPTKMTLNERFQV